MCRPCLLRAECNRDFHRKLDVQSILRHSVNSLRICELSDPAPPLTRCPLCGRFAKNLTADKINISTMRGEGEMSNLELNEAVMTDLLELPAWMRITRVWCNRVTVRIHWTKLKSVPIYVVSCARRAEGAVGAGTRRGWHGEWDARVERSLWFLGRAGWCCSERGREGGRGWELWEMR